MEKGELIGAGRTAEVYAWGDDRVLKLYFPFMGREPIEREFSTTRAVRDLGLPVPAADEMIEEEGRLGIVFERLRGPSLSKIVMKNPTRLTEIAQTLAQLHALMHSKSLPAGACSQRGQIEYGIGAAADLTSAEKEGMRARLAALPDGDAVCHGDFHVDNVILTDDGPVVIDWMTGSRGNPSADIARTELLFATGGLPPGTPLVMTALLNSARLLAYRSYLRRYSRLRPVSRDAIREWLPAVAAARLSELGDYPDEKRLVLRRVRRRGQRP
jgi:uncharacterized protein (TIGR02172 family)